MQSKILGMLKNRVPFTKAFKGMQFNLKKKQLRCERYLTKKIIEDVNIFLKRNLFALKNRPLGTYIFALWSRQLVRILQNKHA